MRSYEVPDTASTAAARVRPHGQHTPWLLALSLEHGFHLRTHSVQWTNTLTAALDIFNRNNVMAFPVLHYEAIAARPSRTRAAVRADSVPSSIARTPANSPVHRATELWRKDRSRDEFTTGTADSVQIFMRAPATLAGLKATLAGLKVSTRTPRRVYDDKCHLNLGKFVVLSCSAK